MVATCHWKNSSYKDTRVNIATLAILWFFGNPGDILVAMTGHGNSCQFFDIFPMFFSWQISLFK